MAAKDKNRESGVRVHSCRRATELRGIEYLTAGRFYYSDDPKFKSFKAIPERCNCRKWVTYEKADILVAKGTALVVYKPRANKALDVNYDVDISQVIMVVNRSQTPRVDLITRSDIERAYLDGRQDYITYIEEIHAMIMNERAKLIAPFREDPCDGRLLFPFGSDQRTIGGHQ
jgi:hypothetical protein